MDLNSLYTKKLASEGVNMNVVSPIDGSELKSDCGITMAITLRGTDSAEFQKIKDDAQAAAIASGKTKMTSEEQDELAVDTLWRLTVGWEGIQHKGKLLEFTESNVKMIYREYPFIREAVNRFSSNRLNFMPAQRTT